MNKIHSILLAAIIGLLVGGPKTEAQNHPATVSPGLYMGLSISGAVGTNYVVQCVNDVAQSNNWKTVDAFALPNSPHLWIDTNGTTPQRRFYRVIEGGGPFAATVTLSGLNQAFDGTAKSVTVTTEPPKLAVAVTYDGLSSPPVNVGRYQVVATVTDGYYFGSATNTLEITVCGQTISFAPLAAHTYGDSLFHLSATASSGLPMSFRSDNSSIAMVSGSKVAIFGAGTANIIATQPGNANYTAALPVTNSLTVNKAILTVRADDKTKLEGADNPVLTATFSGFVNGETVTVLSGMPALSTTTNSPVGTYPITVAAGTLSAANYKFSFVPGTLTVTPSASAGMALIPASVFEMGDALDVDSSALPLHMVNVSPFYMDTNLVTKALWDDVYQWATNHGYGFDNVGSGKAATHPVQTVSWYDVVKWCNARSEKERRVPAYYTSDGLVSVYRTGQITVLNNWVKWDSGYRLPTEAEWEKAARGGLSGKRFPWGDTIKQSQANYYSSSSYEYDISPTRGYHPSYNDSVYPCTSPVGSFAANGYGLYDMAGNIWEWCWDWYGSYGSDLQTDPRGVSAGSFRVIRGGGWSGDAWFCRAANRNDSYWPDYWYYDIGFRSVLPQGQP